MLKKFLLAGAVLLVIFIAFVFLYNPIEKGKEKRDRLRVADIDNLKKAVDFYITKNAKTGAPLCENCALGVDVFSYRSITVGSTKTKEIKSQVVNNHGWVPLDLSLNMSLYETPLQLLPLDPLELTLTVRQRLPIISSSFPLEKEDYVYTFTPGADGKFKFTAKMESKTGLEKAKNDGGTLEDRYEVGELSLKP